MAFISAATLVAASAIDVQDRYAMAILGQAWCRSTDPTRTRRRSPLLLGSYSHTPSLRSLRDLGVKLRLSLVLRAYTGFVPSKNSKRPRRKTARRSRFHQAHRDGPAHWSLRWPRGQGHNVRRLLSDVAARTAPTAMALTRIPFLAHAAAIDPVRLFIAALAAP